MALIYIACSVCCSLALAQILKIAEQRKLAVMKVLTVNYAAGSLISFAGSPEISSGFDSVQFDSRLLFFIVFLGVIFIANLLVYSKSIDRVGMGVSIAAMRMSLVLPIGASLFIFGEQLTGIRYFGILIALFSLFLMVPRIRNQAVSGISDAWLPVLIFVMTGLADTGMKIYERIFEQQVSEGLFMSAIFLVSFVIGVMVLLKQGRFRFTPKEIGLGIVAGLVNLYSSIFLIYALRLMPGSVVFSLVNVSLVITGTLIGIWLWSDSPGKKQWMGLVLAIVSIILLLG